MVFGVTTNKVTMNIHHTNNEVFTKNLLSKCSKLMDVFTNKPKLQILLFETGDQTDISNHQKSCIQVFFWKDAEAVVHRCSLK